MRITLHAVHAEDYPGCYAAMLRSLRAARLNDQRFSGTGLSAADVDALLPVALEFTARPRTNAEMDAFLGARMGTPEPRIWWAMRTFAPVLHAPSGGPWMFGARPSYVSAGPPPPRERDQAVRWLLRRYLEGFGPAAVADAAQFTLLARAVVRAALRTMGDEVRSLPGPDGTELFDVPGAPIPDGDTPAPARLLPMWDSTLLAYADRSRIIPPEYRRLVIRSNGDVLPTLLVDGYVAGVWRPVEGGIEATAFHRLPDEAWTALAKEAGALAAFLADRDPTVYRRYARWWANLPDTQVRVLPG